VDDEGYDTDAPDIDIIKDSIVFMDREKVMQVFGGM
jgi:hypothetical protein